MTNEADERAVENTVRDLWREAPGDYYSPRIFVNAAGGIGMDVGRHCIVLPIRRWHELAARAASPVSAPLFGRAMLVLKALQLGTKNELHPEIRQEIASICAEFEAVAPVSAEQPTKIASGRESAESELNQAGAASNQATEHKTAESRNGREADNTPETRGAVITTPSLRNEPLAAPSVASEDSATQPIDMKRFEQAPCYLCGYNGPKYFNSEHHACAKLYHAAPYSSEDWMRKAGIAINRRYVEIVREHIAKHGPITQVIEDPPIDANADIIREHYAASQLTDKKSNE